MNSKRLRLILLGSIAVLVLAFAITYVLGTSMLVKKSQKMVGLKAESKALEGQLESLAKAKKEVQQYGYFKDVAKTVIPNDKDQAQAVVDIVKVANESGIALQSITFPVSNLGGATSSAPAATTAPSPTPAAGSAPTGISQAKPVAGIAGLYSLELTITPDTNTQLPQDKQVTYSKMLDFLKRIERNRRTAQITKVDIQLQNIDDIELINFSLVINIFIKP